MLSTIQELILMATEPKLSGKIRAKIELRIKAGVCLCCDRPATRRGLCVAHYHQYRRALQARDKVERVDFESRAIRAGKVLARHTYAAIRRGDPFVSV
jgi:hypothetical protein